MKQNIPKFVSSKNLVISTEDVEMIALDGAAAIILKMKVNETVTINYDGQNIAEAEFERIVKELCPKEDWRETDGKE